MATYPERIAAIDAEIAELDRIISAPRRRAELVNRRHALEQRMERDRRLERTRELIPDYDDRLAAAQAELAEAEAEVAAIVEADTRRAAKGKAPDGSIDGGALGERGRETLVIPGGVVGVRVRPIGRLVTESPRLNLARHKLDDAKRRLRFLERRPAAIAQAEAQGIPIGEGAPERIANAHHVNIGQRIGSRFRKPRESGPEAAA